MQFLIIVTATVLIFPTLLVLKCKPDDDEDIYLAIRNAVEELKARQLAGALLKRKPYRRTIKQETEATKIPETEFALDNKGIGFCYDELGCFDTDDATYEHFTDLPDLPETISTKFLLYTRQNEFQPYIMDYKKPETILNSNLNPKLPLIIINHGFNGNGQDCWLLKMKQVFLEKEEVNILIIDWSIGARMPNYLQASINTQLVGTQAAVLFLIIKDRLGVHEKDVHIIGYSLGAHVAGFFGKKMKDFRGIKPRRITGLDPAGPCFEKAGSEVHLYKDDADYVDVIHTNADSLIFFGLGIERAIGHADFYPNGGKIQPGCKSTIKGAVKDIFNGFIKLTLHFVKSLVRASFGDRLMGASLVERLCQDNKERTTCSHQRAVHLFIESIVDSTFCEFKGYQCSDYAKFEQAKCMSRAEQCGLMGFKARGWGTYFLMTRSKSPFCAELAELIVKYPSKIKQSRGALILTLISVTGNTKTVKITSSSSEKLVPGCEIRKAIKIKKDFENIARVDAQYIKHTGMNPWTSGRENFGLASIIIKDPEGQFIYKSCKEVNLKDKQHKTLEQTDKDC